MERRRKDRKNERKKDRIGEIKMWLRERKRLIHRPNADNGTPEDLIQRKRYKCLIFSSLSMLEYLPPGNTSPAQK